MRSLERGGVSFADVRDGLSNTILLVERRTPVNWMEPFNVLQEHAYLGVNRHESGIGSEHQGGVNVGMADGSVQFMQENIPLDILRALLTKAGSESVTSDEYLEPWLLR